ncbi:MAG: hypothetical protein PHG35_03345 [Dehalococcoidales bacterium]|nr:hypothetical protein [Dehalococcoidales bacterium]
MSITVVAKFTVKDTVEVWAYIYYQGTLVDPTGSITIDIYDPSGTKQVNGAAMTKSATGIYYYQYHKGATAAMATLKWRGSVYSVDGAGDLAVTSETKFAFEVE